LVARNFLPGDRFIPLGMVGHKKIKDLFMELKIPSEKRVLIPILISRETPVWICGYRIDERFKITSETEKILMATLHQSSMKSSSGEDLGKRVGI
ncbi:MAG: tRNA lysidine(34) synthetase TilS, partial [Deltaproteobacteria bacterium]|nr:tRNA lysidine(34) synthetase TilS [Deltaproteobacteria bacterium]